MARNRYAEADKSDCVACGVCMNGCPVNAVSIWKGCYAVIDKDVCIGCGKCARSCPVGCIAPRIRKEA